MGDQGETKPETQSGLSSMTEINEALPEVTSNTPPAPVYQSATPQFQYQQSPPTVPYQQSYTGGRSPPSYAQMPIENPLYYSYPLGQQPDPSSAGYQYGAQVGYRNSPSPVTLPHFPSGSRQPMQSQGRAYSLPQFQYPQQQYPQPLGRAMSIPSYSTSPPSRANPQFLQPSSSYPVYGTPSFYPNVSPPVFSDETSTDPLDLESLLPRGPPRKPKQSGFALWVGNLPPDVLLEELKDFFALEGLESIFLIRKSNCAFVNYETEEACALALSIFNGKCITFT